MDWRQIGRGVALAAGLAGLYTLGPSLVNSKVPDAPINYSDTVANRKLLNLEERLSHLPEVRSTIRCLTPGARVGVAHIRNIHHSPDVFANLRTVIESEDLELAGHAHAVLQEQYLLLSMNQEEVYGIIKFLHGIGMRELTVEGATADGTWEEAAREYAEILQRLRGAGMFSLGAPDFESFIEDPASATTVSQFTEVAYFSKYAGSALPSKDEKEAHLREQILALAKFLPDQLPASKDFEMIRYAPGGYLLASADFGLRMRQFEDGAYSRQVIEQRRLAQARGEQTDWRSITDGRERRFLDIVRARSDDGDLVVTTLGAGHAFGGYKSCPDVPRGTFENRLSFEDTLWRSNEESGTPVSVLEIEPVMIRNIEAQTDYNAGIANALVDELLNRRAHRNGTSYDQERKNL